MYFIGDYTLVRLSYSYEKSFLTWHISLYVEKKDTYITAIICYEE